MQPSSVRSRFVRGAQFSLFVVLCLIIVGMGTITDAQARPPAQAHHELWMQSTAKDFAVWEHHGTTIKSNNNRSEVQLVSSPKWNCAAEAIDGGKARYDAKSGLCSGHDPFPAGRYDGRNYYNGGDFFFGRLVSPIHTTRQPVQTLIPSWNGSTPPGTWLQVHIRVQVNKQWTHWYKLPVWASDFSAIKRHSIDGQVDATGRVDTDAFTTVADPATAYQVSVTLFSTSPQASPRLGRIAVVASFDAASAPSIAPDRKTWGRDLAVPQRSQMLPEYKGLAYGGGGEVWCSPTSTSMVMAYWSEQLKRPQLNQKVPDAARDTYDFTYDGTGNWPFNTAYAGNFGLHSFITRFYSMSQVEQWIKLGVPLIISLAYKEGELPGAPIKKSNGHLMVVRGFTSSGDVIVNDPAAATNQATRIVYKRAAIEKAWLSTSKGTTYVIYPEGWKTPSLHRMTSW